MDVIICSHAWVVVTCERDPRARLPVVSRNSLIVEGKTLVLAMPDGCDDEFKPAAIIITRALEAIETLPVIPREIEDILTISKTERRRWLEDGRLPSAGTRTVKLRGRARQITFHVFDPTVKEELLDRGAADEWHEEDATAKLESRRRAAYKAKLTRSLKKDMKGNLQPKASPQEASSGLAGWEEFGKNGLLR